MRHFRILAALALALALTAPALAQSTHQHGAPSDAAKTADAAKPAVDPAKADLLHQEYVAKTAELRGKITAREAELETLLATNPDDAGAIKKLTGDIAALRGQLLEQTTLFRVRYAKETGTPIRETRGFGHKGGMMMGKGMDGGCMMMGKGMMGGMDMGKDGSMSGHDMGKSGQGMMMGGMGKGGQGMAMPGMAAPAKAPAAAPAEAPKAN